MIVGSVKANGLTATLDDEGIWTVTPEDDIDATEWANLLTIYYGEDWTPKNTQAYLPFPLRARVEAVYRDFGGEISLPPLPKIDPEVDY